MDSNERDEKYMVSFGDCIISRILRGGHRQQCFRRNEKLPTIRYGRRGITFYDKLQLWYSEVSNVGRDRVPCSGFIFRKSMRHTGSLCFIMTSQFTFVFSCARMKIYLAPEFIIAIIPRASRPQWERRVQRGIQSLSDSRAFAESIMHLA